MKVIKRDGRKVDYNSDKIVIAISNANKEVGGKDKISRSSIEFITKYIDLNQILIVKQTSFERNYNCYFQNKNIYLFFQFSQDQSLHFNRSM